MAVFKMGLKRRQGYNVVSQPDRSAETGKDASASKGKSGEVTPEHLNWRLHPAAPTGMAMRLKDISGPPAPN